MCCNRVAPAGRNLARQDGDDDEAVRSRHVRMAAWPCATLWGFMSRVCGFAKAIPKNELELGTKESLESEMQRS